MNRIHRYVLPFIAAGIAWSAETISGPVAGYVTDSSRTQLRTIFGVPGALRFSDPLVLPAGIRQIRLAPGQDFALVENTGSAPGVLALKAGAVDRLTPVPDALPSADWAAFSPAAGSAILYSLAAGRLQVLSGLPDAPRVTLDLDATTLPEQPAIGAVSDDGSLVLVASATSLYRLSSGGSAQLVLSAAAISSLAVLRNGTDAVLTDPSTGSVELVRNAGSGSQARVLASGLDGMGAIFPSPDGQTLYVARPGGVSAVDLASGAVQSFASSEAPAGLLPLRNRDTFLISAKSNQPAWIFYRDGTAGRTVFVPADDSATRENSARGGVR